MESSSLLARQAEIFKSLHSLKINYGKDSQSRKTLQYLQNRLKTTQNLWQEFDQNHTELLGVATAKDREHEYFKENIYEQTKQVYQSICQLIYSHELMKQGEGSSNESSDKSAQTSGKLDELLANQRANFRAFKRLIGSIDVARLSERWEIQDEINNVQLRWKSIDKLHLEIDSILIGADVFYDDEFYKMESSYKSIKRELNQLLSATAHTVESTPKLQIPIFSGDYTFWPTFFDLFTETIHNNNTITKAQKMQHLKGKLRGEPERLIQHLHISADNYDTAWDILTRRYNNTQVLFTKQIEIFLNQPNINKPTAFELKKLHDTSVECIHAIHNLGVNTHTWDPLIVHLLSRKLDNETLVDYKEARKAPRELPSFDEFIHFLENKFNALEPINRRSKELSSTFKPNNQALSKSTYNYQPKYHSNRDHNNYRYGHNQTHENQALVTYTRRCPLCNLGHDLYFCSDFKNMTLDKKLAAISKLSVCQNCLFSHNGKPCLSIKRCKECNGEHHSLLHDAYKNKSMTSTWRSSTPTSRCSTQPQQSSSASTAPSLSTSYKKPYNVNYVATDDEESLLTTLLLKLKSANGTYVTLRALLDQCAQVSLISENAVQLLGLPRRKFHTAISGTGKGPRFSQGIVNIDCQSIYEDYQFNTEALVVSRVVGNLPNESFHKKYWDHLQNINLADPEYNISRPIDLLLDTTVYSELIMQGLLKGPQHAPMAQQTRVGWILSGTVKTYHCHVLIKEMPDLSKYWELEDIKSDTTSMTSGEEYCEQLYQSTTRRLEDGRYEVAIPMKQGYEKNLGDSKTKAMAQFRQLERKMSNNDEFSNQYKTFMQEYKDHGHMCPAVKSASTPTVYLPHHGVFKTESTTTKLRVVFNASAKTTSMSHTENYSLNDLMEGGLNLQKDLPALILKWRQLKYVVTGDIQRMFNQIKVRKSDQPLQTIIWRDSPQDIIQEYSLTTVTFGTKAAPFLAMRTLLQLARDDREKFPMAAEALETSCYMDDVLCGQDSFEQCKELINQLINILQGAGMNLRKFSSNDPALIKDLPSSKLNDPHEFKCSESRKTLGLKWTPSSDTFSFNYNINYHNINHLSKRTLLSNISKIFDPLGWISPITVRAKLLFQQVWASKVTWDEDLSSDIKEKWASIQTDIEHLHKLSIPRYIGNAKNKIQLHGFCDSSEKVYACAVYIVTCDKGECTSNLLTSKTKLSPLGNKTVSLPRLELSGALLLSQLMKKIMESLSSKDVNIEMYAWTDSMIVLGWLNGDITRWKPFVSNRVKKIIEVIPTVCWHHVRSEENAADCATRGKTTLQLLNHSLWWEGPEWLLKFSPEHLPKLKIEKPNIELKNASVNTALYEHKNNLSFIHELLLNSSSLTQTVRTIAWASRFIDRVRNKQKSYGESLSSFEINRAYQLIIKDVQLYDFNLTKSENISKNKRLANLNPFMDEQGILRVGGRLKNSSIKDTAKHPIILSNHSRFTDLLINQAHLATLHGGPRLTLAYIRDRYWIISGIRTVKRQLRTCVRCRRFSQENRHQLMADLPKARVTPSRPFTHTGTDYAGFFKIKTNKGRGARSTKGYVAVFVCLSTKAVHLELVSDLSTAAFLAAFRRFCSRRGTPKHVYCDNGTNFVGANRLLRQEYKEIQETINQDFFKNISELDIEFHFNAAAWPSAGGLWEACVKSFKYHLKRVMGEQMLTYEEFTTLLHQIEACLNSRPLCPLTENPDDEVLTSGHFLIGGPLISRPQTEPRSFTLTTRWQLIQAMNKEFWKRWSSEYLQQLQTRSKWINPSTNLKINDIVLIKEANLPPGKWALGRVIDVHPGSDGYVRVVSIKTCKNIIKRPVTKLVLLPVNKTTDDNQTNQTSLSEDPAPESSADRNTRPCRYRKKVSFINLLCLALFLFMTLFSPTLQQEAHSSYHIESFKHNQSLYFDKISNLQYIRDDWKLIIFYNMSSYWQGVSDLEYFVRKAKETCTGAQYKGIALQLEHELKEIEHYNTLLNNEIKSRRKRGLINGVGMIANTLFGVLDERFAEQYRVDIEKIAQNENHLQDLLRNQTSVVETEYQILRENEDIMNKQFKLIKQHIHDLSYETNQLRIENQQGLYILSSSLSTQIIISNIRRIQHTLIQTVTDISHGHIDTLLLPPEELQRQLNIISSQLKGDVTLPVEKTNLMEFYKLIKVYARFIDKYLIIEATIPLISSEIFQLDKIISIPHMSSDNAHFINPTADYISFNLKKDLFTLHSDTELQSCINLPLKTLCSLNKPLYNLKENQSLCDNNIVNIETMGSHCISYQVACADRWVKLHRPNVWMFSCCQECKVRIFCNSEFQMEQLRGNGLITLGQGCVLKGSDLTIYSHNNFISNISKQYEYETPKVSILNSIVSTSISPNFTDSLPTHNQVYHQLQKQIADIKEQSPSHISIHDIHHYIITYTLISILLAIGAILVFIKLRKSRRARVSAEQREPPQERPQQEKPATCASVSEVHEMCQIPSDLRQSVLCIDKSTSTSPIVNRSLSFRVPPSE